MKILRNKEKNSMLTSRLTQTIMRSSLVFETLKKSKCLTSIVLITLNEFLGSNASMRPGTKHLKAISSCPENLT